MEDQLRQQVILLEVVEVEQMPVAPQRLQVQQELVEMVVIFLML